MPDLYASHASGLDSPAYSYTAVTLSDSTDLTTYARALYVGVGGTVVAVRPDNTAVTFVGVPTGTVLPIRCRRVNNTNTTASSIVAMW